MPTLAMTSTRISNSRDSMMQMISGTCAAGAACSAYRAGAGLASSPDLEFVGLDNAHGSMGTWPAGPARLVKSWSNQLSGPFQLHPSAPMPTPSPRHLLDTTPASKPAFSASEGELLPTNNPPPI